MNCRVANVFNISDHQKFQSSVTTILRFLIMAIVNIVRIDSNKITVKFKHDKTLELIQITVLKIKSNTRVKEKHNFKFCDTICSKLLHIILVNKLKNI